VPEGLAPLPEPFVTSFDSASFGSVLYAHAEDVAAANLLPAWSHLSLHPQLAATLHSQNFKEPTTIQSAALQPAIGGRDVIGVAETVRTIAYPP